MNECMGMVYISQRERKRDGERGKEEGERVSVCKNYFWVPAGVAAATVAAGCIHFILFTKVFIIGI